MAAEVPALPVADVVASMELPAESSHHSVHAMRQQEFALAAPLDVGALYAQNQNKLKLLQVGILGGGRPQHPDAASCRAEWDVMTSNCAAAGMAWHQGVA